MLALSFAVLAVFDGPAAAHGQHPHPALGPAQALVPTLSGPLPAGPGAAPAAVLVATLAPRPGIARVDGTAGWAFVLGGAAAGAALGFSIAAPDCLDGSRGCGSKPLVYAAVGSAVGAAVGWALHRMIRG